VFCEARVSKIALLSNQGSASADAPSSSLDVQQSMTSTDSCLAFTPLKFCKQTGQQLVVYATPVQWLHTRDEHWSGLGLDRIQIITNFFGFWFGL